MREWPGLAGPLVHLAFDESSLIASLVAALAPRYRVWSVALGDVPYQVAAFDVLRALDQFGFERPVLIGERLGSVPGLLLAAWFPDRLGGLVLHEPTFESHAAGLLARSLRDAPPDVTALRNAVTCPLLIGAEVPEIESLLVDSSLP